MRYSEISSAVMGKSQIPILHKNLKSFILKTQIPWPKSKSKPQIPTSKLEIPNPSFSTSKHELCTTEKGTTCSYLSVSVSMLLDSMSLPHEFQSRQEKQLKPVNSTCDTTKH